MSKLTQRQSVFLATVFVMNLKDDHVGYVQPNSEQRKQIVDLVTDDLMSGRAEFSDEAKATHNTKEKVRKYTTGMVSNWLRKDTRLNQTGEKYEIKSPGSRAGQGDAVLKNLKALQDSLTEQAHKDAVQVKIDERKAELAKETKKQVTIDIDKIPEELRHLIPA